MSPSSDDRDRPQLVTGGGFGPEGGLVALPLLAVGGAGLYWWVRREYGAVELLDDVATPQLRIRRGPTPQSKTAKSTAPLKRDGLRDTRQLRRRSLEVGFGAWVVGTDWWGDRTRDDAIDMVQHALDEDVTFFDTGDVYGHGDSEEVIGEALADTATRLPSRPKSATTSTTTRRPATANSRRKSRPNGCTRC